MTISQHSNANYIEWGARLQRVFIHFHWNLARMLPDNVAKNPCRAVLFVASSESNDYLRKATACLIKTESLTAKKKNKQNKPDN